jgi:uncharacterized integral membrane protein
MKKLLAFIAFAIIFFIALIFSLRNFQPVEIDLILFSSSLPLAVILTLEFFAGVFLGVFATLIHFKHKQQKSGKKS